PRTRRAPLTSFARPHRQKIHGSRLRLDVALPFGRRTLVRPGGGKDRIGSCRSDDMTRVVGIDLGTTNTVVAAVRDGNARALADEQDHTLIPSVVSFHPNGSVLVGRTAKERRTVDPSNTIFS